MSSRRSVSWAPCFLLLLPICAAEVRAEPPATSKPPAAKAAPAPAAPAPAASAGKRDAKAGPEAGKPAPAAGAQPAAAAPEGKKASVPLAPTKEELDRLRAAQKQEPEMGAGYGSKKLLRRPFPTSTGNTAGPAATQGAGTNQDRKAATLEAGGPTQGVHRAP